MNTETEKWIEYVRRLRGAEFVRRAEHGEMQTLHIVYAIIDEAGNARLAGEASYNDEWEMMLLPGETLEGKMEWRRIYYEPQNKSNHPPIALETAIDAELDRWLAEQNRLQETGQPGVMPERIATLLLAVQVRRVAVALESLLDGAQVGTR